VGSCHFDPPLACLRKERERERERGERKERLREREDSLLTEDPLLCGRALYSGIKMTPGSACGRATLAYRAVNIFRGKSGKI